MGQKSAQWLGKWVGNGMAGANFGGETAFSIFGSFEVFF